MTRGTKPEGGRAERVNVERSKNTKRNWKRLVPRVMNEPHWKGGEREKTG